MRRAKAEDVAVGDGDSDAPPADSESRSLLPEEEDEESGHRRRSRRPVNLLPSPGTFRRGRRGFVALCCLLFIFILGVWETNPKQLAVTLVRSTVVPAARSCLPKGKVPDGDVKFALTSIYLPKDGPAHWNESQREMLALTESNKARYCDQVRAEDKKVCTYLNGTRWAEEHYRSTSSYAGLDQIKGSERGVWFKPTYLRSLLRNMTSNNSDKEAFEWILYMDVDAMIVNLHFDLRSLLAGADDDVALIISRDAESPVNSGIFLIRGNELGMMVMDGWLSDPKAGEKMNDQAFLAGMLDLETGLMKEQYVTSNNGTNDATVAVRPRMKMVRQCALAAGGGIEVDPKTKMPFVEGAYAKGDFAVHFFGR
jgi:hypothetical protein